MQGRKNSREVPQELLVMRVTMHEHILYLENFIQKVLMKKKKNSQEVPEAFCRAERTFVKFRRNF